MLDNSSLSLSCYLVCLHMIKNFQCNRVLIVAQWVKNPTLSPGGWGFNSWSHHSLLMGWRSGVAASYSIGHRCGSDPALLWLWHGPAAAATIWSLAQELPYAIHPGIKQTNKTKKPHTISIKRIHPQRRTVMFINYKVSFLHKCTCTWMHISIYINKAIRDGFLHILIWIKILKMQKSWKLQGHHLNAMCLHIHTHTQNMKQMSTSTPTVSDVTTLAVWCVAKCFKANADICMPAYKCVCSFYTIIWNTLVCKLFFSVNNVCPTSSWEVHTQQFIFMAAENSLSWMQHNWLRLCWPHIPPPTTVSPIFDSTYSVMSTTSKYFDYVVFIFPHEL